MRLVSVVIDVPALPLRIDTCRAVLGAMACHVENKHLTKERQKQPLVM